MQHLRTDGGRVGGDDATSHLIVRRLVQGPDSCALLLEDHARTSRQLLLPAGPDRHGADALRRQGLHALSVLLQIGRAGDVRCSALFRAPTGPVRLPVSEGIALSLCAGGHRTVVTLPSATRGRARAAPSGRGETVHR